MINRTNFKRRILVVDDEPLVLQTLTLLLRVDGHSVVPAASGSEALLLFQPGEFDLVFTDYVMPLMNGDKLAAEIKRRAPTQPVIAITAYTEELRRVPVPWFDCHIGKPFELKQLRDLIQQYSPTPG